MRLRILMISAVLVAAVAPFSAPSAADQVGVGEESDAYGKVACAWWDNYAEEVSSRTEVCGFLDDWGSGDTASVALWHETCDGSGCSYSGTWNYAADGDVVIDYDGGVASVNTAIDGCAIALSWSATDSGIWVPLPYDLTARVRDGRVEAGPVLDNYEWRPASADGGVCELASGAATAGYLEQFSERTTYLYVDPRHESPVASVTSRSEWSSYMDMGCAGYSEQLSDGSNRYTSACGYESADYGFAWLDISDSTCRYSGTGAWCEGTFSYNDVDPSALHFDVEGGVGSISAVVFDCAVDLSFTATGPVERYTYTSYLYPDVGSDGAGVIVVSSEDRYRDSAATGSICHLASGDADNAWIGAWGESSEELWVEPKLDGNLATI